MQTLLTSLFTQHNYYGNALQRKKSSPFDVCNYQLHYGESMVQRKYSDIIVLSRLAPVGLLQAL